jgi:hypothetical protein
MPVEIGPPRSAPRPKGRYTDFVDAMVQANGEWVSVPVEQIWGPTNDYRSKAIHHRVRIRKLRCNVTIRNGRFYARIRKAGA